MALQPGADLVGIPLAQESYVPVAYVDEIGDPLAQLVVQRLRARVLDGDDDLERLVAEALGQLIELAVLFDGSQVLKIDLRRDPDKALQLVLQLQQGIALERVTVLL